MTTTVLLASWRRRMTHKRTSFKGFMIRRKKRKPLPRASNWLSGTALCCVYTRQKDILSGDSIRDRRSHAKLHLLPQTQSFFAILPLLPIFFSSFFSPPLVGQFKLKKKRDVIPREVVLTQIFTQDSSNDGDSNLMPLPPSHTPSKYSTGCGNRIITKSNSDGRHSLGRYLPSSSKRKGWDLSSLSFTSCVAEINDCKESEKILKRSFLKRDEIEGVLS